MPFIACPLPTPSATLLPSEAHSKSGPAGKDPILDIYERIIASDLLPSCCRSVLSPLVMDAGLGVIFASSR